MRSIPRQLLIHSAEIRNPLSEDSFGNILYSEPEYIKYVRIDFTDNFVITIYFSVIHKINNNFFILWFAQKVIEAPRE